MIDSKEKLRAAYPPAKERSVKKQLTQLDKHCLHFIALSPFVVLSSGTLLPTMGQLLADQIGEPALAESQAQMVERYKADL